MNNLYHESHNLFFKVIDTDTLTELYRRADTTTNILQNDINSRLVSTYRTEVHINNSCHIFINFLRNNINIGHISLHITAKDKSLSFKSQEIGRFHAVNELPPYEKYIFKLNTNDNKPFFSYHKGKRIKTELKNILDISINVLNDYFNPASSISLNIQPTGNYIHKCSGIVSKTIRIKKSKSSSTIKLTKNQ
jgi:hypothetical protein